MEIQTLKLELPGAEDYSLTLLALEAGVVVGKLRLEGFIDPALWIGVIWVEPAWRGKHIGRLLLTATEKIAREQNKTALTLTCHKENKDAQRFYHRYGFFPYGSHHEHYNTWILPLTDTYQPPSYEKETPPQAVEGGV